MSNIQTLIRMGFHVLGCLLIAFIAPFATYPYLSSISWRIVWFSLSLFIVFGANLLSIEKVRGVIKAEGLGGKFWRAGAILRNLMAWGVLLSSLSFLILLVFVRRKFPDQETHTAVAQWLKWQDISLFSTFLLSLLTLPRWQSFVGIGAILLSIFLAYGA